mgnify:CR=1 FL=1
MAARALAPWEVEKWATAEKRALSSYFGFDNLNYRGFDGDDDGNFFGFNQAVESVRTQIANTSATSGNGRDMFCKTRDAAQLVPIFGLLDTILCGHSAVPDAFFAVKKNKQFLFPEDVAELQNILNSGCNRIQKNARKNRCLEWVGRAIGKLNKEVNEVMAGGGPGADPTVTINPTGPRRVTYGPQTGLPADASGEPNVSPQNNAGGQNMVPILLVVGGLVLTYFVLKKLRG